MLTETTRRTFLGTMGAAAAMAAPRGSKVQTATTEKCLFWVAACTPCDKNLKFDEAYYRDMMAYFKDQSLDGNAEFPGDARAVAARRGERSRRVADHSAVLFQEAAASRLDEILFTDFRSGENSDQPLSHPRH